MNQLRIRNLDETIYRKCPKDYNNNKKLYEIKRKQQQKTKVQSILQFQDAATQHPSCCFSNDLQDLVESFHS